jgi:hypothetical protein
MKNILFILLMNVITFTFTTGCATYPYSGSVEMRDENVWFKAAFNDEDRRLIHDYYRAQYKTLPPGLAKKDTLPPGIHKQLRRKGTLPPGLEKRRLPVELEKRLSSLPRGYVRLKVGGDVVLLNEITHVIIDVIYHVGE